MSRPTKENKITYATIADMLDTKEELVRQWAHRGLFDLDDIMSTINFIHGKLLLDKAKSNVVVTTEYNPKESNDRAPWED